jgi:drug/metabolite transporter (DMT)-like permease
MPRHGPADWTLLLALTALWGSAFLLTKVAVGGISPGWVVTGRLALAAALLLPLAALSGQGWPRDRRTWGFLALIALTGNALPFWLITWGQRGIDSGVSGILMAVMPLAVLALAHGFVPGESLTRRRLLGFALGFAGVAVLFWPQAGQRLAEMSGVQGPLRSMLAVLGGALCYAVSSILARLRPPQAALPTAALVTLLATLLTLPLAAATAPLPSLWLTQAEVLSVVGLGVFSTAVAAVLYFRLIVSAGPSFAAQLNYLIPPWAVLMGIVFLGESPRPNHFYSLALILAGVLIAATGRRPAGDCPPRARR